MNLMEITQPMHICQRSVSFSTVNSVNKSTLLSLRVSSSFLEESLMHIVNISIPFSVFST